MKNLCIWLFFLFFIASCTKAPYPIVPEEVSATINKSGKNYVELLEAIVEYRKPEDSLKLKSLYYLLAHYPSHGYRTYLLHDTNGELIDYNIRDAKSYYELLQYRDSLARQHGELAFKRHYFGKDIYKLAAEQLVDHVDRSYSIWKNSPWDSAYAFETFLHYILPMRLNSGPNDDWISIIRDTLLTDFRYSEKNVFKVADSIINAVKPFMKWDARYTQNPTDQGWVTMKNDNAGRCEDMAVLMVAALRAHGIASAIDFIPLPLEPVDEISYWVTVWDPQGNKKRYFPFDDTLKLPTVFTKVFRRRFHSYNQHLPEDAAYESLDFQHLEQANYRDVTKEYHQVKMLELPAEYVSGKVQDFAKVFLYLPHQEKWIPVDWKYFHTDILTFSNYLPGIPFLLKTKQGYLVYEQP